MAKVTGVQRLLRKRHPVRDFITITLGILLTAFALDAFLIPNKIAAGGASGLATVLFYLGQRFGVDLPIGIQLIAMNAILFIFVWRAGGLKYIAKTLYGTIGLSVAIDVIALFVGNLAPHDKMLAAVAGGALVGLGMGLVFKVGANTGGTDILVQLIAPKTQMGTGRILLLIDGVVIVIAGFVLGPESALYAGVSIAITAFIIDVVIEGISVEKACWIISNSAEDVGLAITNDLGRGCTRIEATGVWTGMERPILFVVLTRREIGPLKDIVAHIDPNALVVISDVYEALGEGFKEIGVD